MRHQEDQELRIQFLADLFCVSIDAATPEAQEQAVEQYLHALQPWVRPGDSPFPPRPVFPLFTEVRVEHQGEDEELFSVTFSLEAELYFHAWLRRRAVGPPQTPPLMPQGNEDT